jgi:hypothetical protein
VQRLGRNALSTPICFWCTSPHIFQLPVQAIAGEWDGDQHGEQKLMCISSRFQACAEGTVNLRFLSGTPNFSDFLDLTPARDTPELLRDSFLSSSPYCSLTMSKNNADFF